MVNNLRVVIAAAGTGSRMKSSINKQYMLLNSRPILSYSLDVFEKFEVVDEIVIVAHSRDVEYCEKEIVDKFGYRKVKKVIPGGEQRQDSVWAGLLQLNRDTTDYVAVHDGARPLLTSALLSNLITGAAKWGAAIPGIYVRDTLKMVGQDGFVDHTLDRSRVVFVQTPQIFNFKKIYQAYEMALKEGFTGTDDASLFEKYMGRVKVVPGNYRNLKITTPEDLIIAQALLSM